jgi:hypothetical protein
MKYHLFIDESGDHGLITTDQNFPVFVLCGVLISDENLKTINAEMDKIKSAFWGDKKVIFHSRDIRKCEKEFVLLFDTEVKKEFYESLNRLVSKSDYSIIASAIRKDNYIKRYGRLSNDVYEIALSFIIERTVFLVDDKPDSKKELSIIIEERGKKEDRKLSEHFSNLLARGTGFVEPKRLIDYHLQITFRNKKENVNGLQLADLVAYPIARYVIDPHRANPAFDLLESKIYAKNGKKYGLKIFP